MIHDRIIDSKLLCRSREIFISLMSQVVVDSQCTTGREASEPWRQHVIRDFCAISSSAACHSHRSAYCHLMGILRSCNYVFLIVNFN